MVVPLVAKVSGNDDYRRAVVSRGIPLQGTGAFGMLLVEVDGQRASGLRFADTAVQALLSALLESIRKAGSALEFP
jgi:hypothetical protein